MSEFKVGEKVWIIPFQLREIDLRGYCCTEATIIAPLAPHKQAIGGYAYEVRTHDGLEVCATPRILRRFIPPEELGIERSAETVSGEHG